MLDTDSVSCVIRGAGRVAERLVAHQPSEICLSAITLAELRYGAERLHSPKMHRAIGKFVRTVRVAAFDADCALTFGRIAAKLAAKGEIIGDTDAMIAAHALSLDLTLVTNNTRHFARVPGLRAVNWF